MSIRPIPLLTLSLILSLVTSCSSPDQTAPTISIVSPALNSSVTGTTAIQLLARDEGSIQQVDVFARGLGGIDEGILVGSAGNESINPAGNLSIPWYTGTLPNDRELELYAVATDPAGNQGKSKSTRVRISNSDAPSLKYFAGFNLPKAPTQGLSTPTGQIISSQTISSQTISSQSDMTSSSLLQFLPIDSPDQVKAPLNVQAVGNTSSQNPNRSKLTPRASSHALATEWAWDAVSNVKGYAIYLGANVVGPYTKQVGVQPNGSTGTQKYSKFLKDTQTTQNLWGVVSSLGSGESSFSNTDQAFLLKDQAAGTVLTASTGRPTLNWPANEDPQTAGYLFYVYKKNPLTSNEAAVWSTPNSRAVNQLTIDYPSSRDPLPAGTYYWWVAAVSFSDTGRASGFSFSDPQTFVVP